MGSCNCGSATVIALWKCLLLCFCGSVGVTLGFALAFVVGVWAGMGAGVVACDLQPTLLSCCWTVGYVCRWLWLFLSVWFEHLLHLQLCALCGVGILLVWLWGFIGGLSFMAVLLVGSVIFRWLVSHWHWGRLFWIGGGDPLGCIFFCWPAVSGGLWSVLSGNWGCCSTLFNPETTLGRLKFRCTNLLFYLTNRHFSKPIALEGLEQLVLKHL